MDKRKIAKITKMMLGQLYKLDLSDEDSINFMKIIAGLMLAALNPMNENDFGEFWNESVDEYREMIGDIDNESVQVVNGLVLMLQMYDDEFQDGQYTALVAKYRRFLKEFIKFCIDDVTDDELEAELLNANSSIMIDDMLDAMRNQNDEDKD